MSRGHVAEDREKRLLQLKSCVIFVTAVIVVLQYELINVCSVNLRLQLRLKC